MIKVISFSAFFCEVDELPHPKEGGRILAQALLKDLIFDNKVFDRKYRFLLVMMTTY
ncbi:hypothetical protein NON08_14655 [Cetobacterium somerae]|uniref:hypothetical protein n=1 Tax=Cetobacterium sp. NK01 TaxID=2993530 RepID=UPI002115E542|nr:hypothetical protein [Cetobacterium sp. NK01]MCQ8213739.1 hypothetical protein [Cetobacterium sp. NK01]